MGIEKFASEIARAADRKVTGNGPVLGLGSFALSALFLFLQPAPPDGRRGWHVNGHALVGTARAAGFLKFSRFAPRLPVK